MDDFHILLKDIQIQTGMALNMDVDTSKKSSTFKDSTGSTNYRDKFKENLSEEMIDSISKVLKVFGIEYPY